MGNWGGKRIGAGRKDKANAVNHWRRVRVDCNKPMHLTLRLKKGIANLRCKKLQKQFRVGIKRCARFGLRVIHYSLQSNHLHLIVEAEDNRCLGRGMQSLAGRFAKIIRKKIGGRGSVFVGRYHLVVIHSARQMKVAIRYVLMNICKHADIIEHLDPFSSAWSLRLDYWPILLGSQYRDLVKTQVESLRASKSQFLDVYAPSTWLAQVGRLKT